MLGFVPQRQPTTVGFGINAFSVRSGVLNREEAAMNTYVILRRSGWRSPEELQQAAARSEEASENMSDDIRWIRSYVMEEESGDLGTVCIYQASSPDAIRRHGDIAVLPVDEIIPVMDSVIKRPNSQ